MSNMSLRLPKELAQKLSREMRIARRGRSEIVREALERYLAEKERERLMADMVRAARAVYGDPGQMDAARRISEDFLAAENEGLDRGGSGQSEDTDSDNPWWN